MLATLVLLSLATTPSLRDGLGQAEVHALIAAGGDGLRGNSHLDVDVYFDNGVMSHGEVRAGIGDHRQVSISCDKRWPSDRAKIAYVDVTLSGQRGGAENADDFDLRLVRITAVKTGRLNDEEFNKVVNMRLTGAGTWTSGLLSAFRPMCAPTGTTATATFVFGEHGTEHGHLQLGLLEDRTIKWGTVLSEWPRVDGLGRIKSIFTFPSPVHYARVTHVYLRRIGNACTLNSVEVHVDQGLANGYRFTLLRQHNVNQEIGGRGHWSSQPFLLREWEVLTPADGGG